MAGLLVLRSITHPSLSVAQVRIDVHGARLIARVDNSQEEVYLKGLNHEYNYGVSTNLPSVVLVGGEYTNHFWIE